MKILATLFILLLMTACQTKETNSVMAEEEPATDVKETIIKADEAVDPEVEEVLTFCTKDAKQCSNGKTVARNPKNNCEFDPCDPPNKKEPVMCTADVKECPDGTFVSRDHYNNCKFKDCPNSEQ